MFFQLVCGISRQSSPTPTLPSPPSRLVLTFSSAFFLPLENMFSGEGGGGRGGRVHAICQLVSGNLFVLCSSLGGRRYVCVCVCICVSTLRRQNTGPYLNAESLSNWTFPCRQNNQLSACPPLCQTRARFPFTSLRVAKPRSLRFGSSCFLRSKFLLTVYIYIPSFSPFLHLSRVFSSFFS